ncbi:MAG: sulfatase-like hydrolase/transferase [Acidobacteriota bacterium]|nr:MAG: sulfatase-like hydrolase/transferase [Acidobacteriota bacterium]
MAKRWVVLLADTALTYAHFILPRKLASKLPPVDRGWAGFLQSQAKEDLGELLERLEGILTTDADTQFIFLHMQTPHFPWIHLPSGQVHQRRNGYNIPLKNKLWLEDVNAVATAYQAHLLEVGYADKVLGELLDLFQRAGIYDSSWLAVCSDHGVGFEPGMEHRIALPGHFRQVLNVPLFIKRPFQTTGAVSDRNVELVDVLPIMAGDLGFEIPWKVDGLSLSAPERKEKRLFHVDRSEPIFLNNKFEQIRELAICFEGEVETLSELSGWLDNTSIDEGRYVFTGWAGNSRSGVPAERVLMFRNGLYEGETVVDLPAPDVARTLSQPSLGNSRFRFEIPVERLTDAEDVRFFAVLEGQFSQLRYGKSYRWLDPGIYHEEPDPDGCRQTDQPYLMLTLGSNSSSESSETENNPVIRLARSVGRDGFFSLTPSASVINLSVPSQLPVSSELRVRLDDPSAFRSIDPEGSFLPCTVAGKVVGKNPPRFIGIGYEGRILSLAAVWKNADGDSEFKGFIRPDQLLPGKMDLEFYACTESRIESRLELN